MPWIYVSQIYVKTIFDTSDRNLLAEISIKISKLPLKVLVINKSKDTYHKYQ